MFKKYKHYKPDRKNYYIKPSIEFKVHTDPYMFAILPTITIEPWFDRYPDACVVCIYWLNFSVGIGVWKVKNDEIF